MLESGAELIGHPVSRLHAMVSVSRPDGRAALPLSWLGLAVLCGFFFNLGAVPLFDLDEGAFSEATREMLLRQDFLSIYLNGQPRFDKPILFHWVQTLSVGALGPTEWGFRLPSAVAAGL